MVKKIEVEPKQVIRKAKAVSKVKPKPEPEPEPEPEEEENEEETAGVPADFYTDLIMVLERIADALEAIPKNQSDWING